MNYNNKDNKAVAMKGLTLSLLHLHFAFQIYAKNSKLYDWAKNFGLGGNFRFG